MAFDFIERQEVVRLIAEAVLPLREEVARLTALTDQNVNTADAMRIMGCGRAWLEKERKRPGTLLEVSYVGSRPTYSRASLLLAKAARKPRRHNTNPPIVPPPPKPPKDDEEEADSLVLA